MAWMGQASKKVPSGSSRALVTSWKARSFTGGQYWSRLAPSGGVSSRLTRRPNSSLKKASTSSSPLQSPALPSSSRGEISTGGRGAAGVGSSRKRAR